MAVEHIWIKNQKYYYYKTYKEHEYSLMMKEARRIRKRNGCRFFFVKAESQGLLDIVPNFYYKLYLNKAMRLL